LETLESSTLIETLGGVVSLEGGEGEGEPAPVTASVPVMNGWTVQKNG
jgi:hypothetical protein